LIRKELWIIALVVAVILSLNYFGVPIPGFDSKLDRLVGRNIAARGGAQAWQGVSTLRMTGEMDLGQGLTVPYVLEQKRPDKMRLEFVFDDQTSVQSVDGDTGWKIAPFRGRSTPQPMTEVELRETAAAGDPGLLFDYEARGYEVELLGEEMVEDRPAVKLKISFPNGAVRWLYLDDKTGLELKVEAIRSLAGRDRLVETYYRDWQLVDGLLFPSRQENRTEGSEEGNLVTIDWVEINPQLDDSRFAMPALVAGGGV
jgi:outer membrane lipoprotein-sorting protein